MSLAERRVLGLRGFSGAGKTTLLVRLIPALRAQGLSVSTVKRAHHGFDVDTPGKDSHRHREAGATEVMVTSGARFALMHELRDEREPTLAELLVHMSPVDLVLVEGFREEPHPKLELWRAANGKPLIGRADPHVVAILTDRPDAPEVRAAAGSLPVLALDDLDAITALVVAHVRGR